ncbi:hypothetical protein C8R47DRAFT_249056 [Mycena vitilis]|nr:hypothetical protein C8R47DRAFT_249056 [Mycena vitilis]
MDNSPPPAEQVDAVEGEQGKREEVRDSTVIEGVPESEGSTTATTTSAPSETASTPSIVTPSPSSPSLSASPSPSPSPSPAPSASPVPSPAPALPTDPTARALASANAGFDHLFANDIAAARRVFSSEDEPQSPFHLLGLGVCAFLEAALGMESGLMGEAARLLQLSEAGAKKAVADAKAGAKAGGAVKEVRVRGDGGGRFAPGLEYEILQADAVVLVGLTHALSESYMGYFQCMYALNAAHSKFTKLYKTVFPAGLDAYTSSASSSLSSTPFSSASTPFSSASLAVSTSGSGLLAVGSAGGSGRGLTHASSSASLAPSSSTTSLSTLSSSVPNTPTTASGTSTPGSKGGGGGSGKGSPGAVEEMVVAGTAFGFGLFNLVFSLLPKKVQSLVGLLGFKHDRALALRALAVSAGINTLGEGGGPGGRDVHGVFAGLVLMTFHGVVLLLAGYQADEARTLRTYKAIVDGIEARYPTGALWILNRAKILRMSNDPQGAIAVLQRALEAPQTFVQADTLLVFELAWTLLAQRRHQEAADAFVKLTELNSWSHATYYFIAAGCYVALGNRDKAQELLDALPELLQRKKVGGKDLPTEVLIRKKLDFYKEKQKRRGGDPARFVEAISISPADELGIFWNNHQRIDDAVAEAHIAELAALTPPVALAVHSPFLPAIDEKHVVLPDTSHDLDTPDERALRALLLGIMHRTLRLYAPARALLEAARGAQGIKTSTWIPGVALFELAVTDLKEAQHGEKGKAKASGDAQETEAATEVTDKAGWLRVLAGAEAKLDGAQNIAGKSDIDLSSRLDSRIALLRDEIAAKRAMIG